MADELFGARCRIALSRVQHDLDATGLREYQMGLANFSPDQIRDELFAALPDGRAWPSGATSGMTPDMDDDELQWVAAETVCDTLMEVLGIGWPICSDHGGQPMRPANDGTMAAAGKSGIPWWSCRHVAGHLVTPVGQLVSAAASPDRMRT